MLKSICYRILFLPILLVVSVAVCAGTPLVTDSGVPYRWDLNAGPVRYMIDPGSLGEFTPEEAQSLVREAMRMWQAVPTATISFKFDGFLSEDISDTNAQEYIQKPDDFINPIVFDDNGAIIDLMLGEGARHTHLGAAQPYVRENGRIVGADLILNGLLAEGGYQGRGELLSTVSHEIGHFIGLGHTQLNQRLWEDGIPANDRYVPIMFPIQSEQNVGPSNLSLDDRSSISFLYPSDSLWTSRGGIAGVVIRRSGEGVQGANVVVTKKEDPFGTAVATVTDLYLRATGEFDIYGLPFGDYKVFVEPVDPRFHGISAVGPFSRFPDSESFIDPVAPEYYSGERESGDPLTDAPDDSEYVHVNLGETADVEIIVNEEDAGITGWMHRAAPIQ